MKETWIDSSVLIQAKNGILAFDLAPGFWQMIERGAQDGTLRSSSTVYDEIIDFGDELSDWARKVDSMGLFVMPDKDVMEAFRPIADYVHSLDRAEADGFLRGADPWLVAHAQHSEGVVATEEQPVTSASKKVRIPNICTRFGVGYINTTELIRRSGVKLVIAERRRK